MIVFNLDDSSELDLSTLRAIGHEVVTMWNSEATYFQHQSGHPFHDHDEYRKLLDTVKANIQNISRSLQLPDNIPQENQQKSLLSVLQSFEISYGELNDYVKHKSTLGRLESALLDRLGQIENSISEDTRDRIDELTDIVKFDIEKGIKDLIGLKSELGLAKQFGGKIQSELHRAKFTEFGFMIAFLTTLLMIPLSNVAILDTFTNIELTAKYIIMGSVSFSMLFISYFFYSQYRTYMMLRLRYTHLDGFLGGGATFLSQLLEAENPDFKLEVNKKLAEMFMSLDDVLQMVHKNKHPTELTLDTAERVFDKVSKFKSPSS